MDKRRGFGAKIEGSWAKIGASGVNIGALVPTAQNVFKLFGPLGATLRQAQGPLRTGILVNSFFFVVELFNVNKIRGFGAKIEGSGAKFGATGVKIGTLVQPTGATLRPF